MLFLIQQTKTHLKYYFSNTICHPASCHDALSPTEVVPLDVLHSIILNALRCNKDSMRLRPSSYIVPFFSMKGDSLGIIMVFNILLLFFIDFETLGKLLIWTNWNNICSALRGHFVCFERSLLILLEPHAIDKNVFDSIERAAAVPIKPLISFCFCLYSTDRLIG